MAGVVYAQKTKIRNVKTRSREHSGYVLWTRVPGIESRESEPAERPLGMPWFERNFAKNTLSSCRQSLTSLLWWLYRNKTDLLYANAEDLRSLFSEWIEGGYKAC